MPNTQNIEIETTAAQHEQDRPGDTPPVTHASRRAAAIEAAYILEAVRK